MKRFLSVIFWRKDPAAGVLFGMALCVGLGLLVMAYGIMLAMTLIDARLLSLTKGLFALFFGLLFYILTLFCLWLTDLFQRTFKLSKWAAIPCGWLTGMVGMAVCAWKLKNRQAFVLAVAASLLFVAHVILKVSGSDLGVWLDVCSFACDGTLFLAFCALVRRRSFYIWGIVLLVLLLLVGYVIRDVTLAHLKGKVTSRIPQPDDEPDFFINGYRVDTGEKSYFIIAVPEETS